MDLFTARWSRSSGWSAPLPAWDGPGTLVLVFGSSDLLDDDTPLQTVVRAFPGSAMIGCSTAGEILDAHVFDGSISVAVARFERTTLAVEAAPVNRSDSAQVGLAVGKRLRDRGDHLAAVFVLADGYDANGSTLAAGLTEGTGGSAVITGGMAGDGSRFERTWVLVDGRPRRSHVSAVGMFGAAVEVASGFDGGWTILGQSMTFTDDVPEGSTAQLMRGTTERLVDAAQTAAVQAGSAGDEPGLAILVSCAGRRMHLGQRVEEELEAVRSELSPACRLVGFYSSGELAPVSDGACALHNMAMSITVLRERPE